MNYVPVYRVIPVGWVRGTSMILFMTREEAVWYGDRVMRLSPNWKSYTIMEDKIVDKSYFKGSEDDETTTNT